MSRVAPSMAPSRWLARHSSRAAAFAALASLNVLVPGNAHAAFADSTSMATVVPASPALPAPKLGGYIQVRELEQKQVGLTAFLNRARFSVDGALPSKFSYRFLTELE